MCKREFALPREDTLSWPYTLLCKCGGLQGRSQDFSKGGSPSGDRRVYMVYTAALPRVSVGSVILSRHEGPY